MLTTLRARTSEGPKHALQVWKWRKLRLGSEPRTSALERGDRFRCQKFCERLNAFFTDQPKILHRHLDLFGRSSLAQAVPRSRATRAGSAALRKSSAIVFVQSGHVPAPLTFWRSLPADILRQSSGILSESASCIASARALTGRG